MDASAAGAGLQPLRAAVGEAAAVAEAARLHLHRRYREEQAAALEAAGGHADGDFACQAWLHAMLRSVDEASVCQMAWGASAARRRPVSPRCRPPLSCPLQAVVAAHLLLLEPAQDRDGLGSWLRAWRGRRSSPPA